MKILLTIAALLILAVPAASAAPPVGDSKSPAKACKAERADDITAFDAKYGKNDNKKNAFGKCVSAKAKEKAKGKDEEKDEEKQEAKATKMCKAERAAKGIEAFNREHGTSKNKKNAFGKCVSKHSKSG